MKDWERLVFGNWAYNIVALLKSSAAKRLSWIAGVCMCSCKVAIIECCYSYPNLHVLLKGLRTIRLIRKIWKMCLYEEDKYPLVTLFLSRSSQLSTVKVDCRTPV